MRHSQGRGSSPYWSAASSGHSGGLFDLSSLTHALHGTPAWVVVVSAAGVAVAALAVAFLAVRGLWRATARARRRSRTSEGWLSGIGPQAVVALGGVAVSVHGLWGFATQTSQLPWPLAVGFIFPFDLAELVLFAMLYRSADPKIGWTPELRLMHKTAWTLVSFSASMNAVYAPTWWSKPILAAIPALAAWLIELQLRNKLRGAKRTEDEGARPGPLRLLVLLWQHGWSAAFAGLGLDARGNSNAIARAALAQRAAGQVYQLRLALEQVDSLKKNSSTVRQLHKAQRKVAKLRKGAQTAMDRADLATDPAQALALVRRMATLTRADEVALKAYTDTVGVMTMMRELLVVPAAEQIASSQRAEEAEAARQRAETARQEAEQEMESLRSEMERAAAARKDLDGQAEQTLAEVEKLRQEAQEEKERAANARQESEAARQEAEAARGRAEAARQRADAEMSDWRRRVDGLEGQSRTEAEKLNEIEAERRRADVALAAVKAEAEQQTAAAERLRVVLRGMEEAERKLAQQQSDRQAAVEKARLQAEDLEGQLREQGTAYNSNKQLMAQMAEETNRAQGEHRKAIQRAEDARKEAAEAEALRDRLRGELGELRPAGPGSEQAPEWRSEAKQLGWILFLERLQENGSEPTAGELAALGNVDDGNARNWLRDFRDRRAQQLAARLPRASRAVDDRVAV